jgi:hypothetical protein
MTSHHLSGLARPRSTSPTRLALAIAGALLPAMAALAAPAEPTWLLRLNSAPLDTRSPALQANREPNRMVDGRQLHLVQFAGAIRSAWRSELERTGVQIVDYIADHGYLVYGDAAALTRVRELAKNDYVLWDGPYAGAMKISAQVGELESRGIAPHFYSIQLVADSATNEDTLALIKQLGWSTYRKQTSRHYVNVDVEMPYGALQMLAARPDVLSVQPGFTPELLDERQNLILANRLSGDNPIVPIAPSAPNGVPYLQWLGDRGFNQAQFDDNGWIVEASDQGLDNGTTRPMHFGLFVGGAPNSLTDPTNSLVVFNKREGTAAAADLTGCGGVGHGTWVSHVIGGNVASVTRENPHGDGSFYFGGGVNPFVRLGNSAIFTTGGAFTNPDFEDLQSRSYTNLGIGVRGARISNNSWGAAVSGAYNASAQAYDFLVRDAMPEGATFSAPGNQEMVIVFAAGNSGPGARTMGSPATGKNVITAGGSQNVRPGVGDAVDAGAMYASSSRGPTADDRIKPDLIAPATNIAGGVVMNDRLTAAPGNHNTCFTGAFLPTTPAQRFYRTGNGTSFSSPAVAGGASLVRQLFANRPAPYFNAAPSPAMTRAYLMNSTTYLERLTDNLPSPNQGMGRMNLERAFDETPRALRDQLPVDRFTDSGQSRVFTGTVADPSKPFRVTLTWSDAPGPTSGAAFVNNLDLRVEAGGQTYLGNVFTQGNSTAGGTADIRNNAESVFLPAGVTGPYTVTVNATNIAGRADPTVAGNNQDFALAVYNSQPIGACPTINVTPGTIPGAVSGGSTYPAQTFTATGGSGQLTWFHTGNLPQGLSLNGNVLSGTVGAGGTYDFTVYARDANGCIGGKGHQVRVVSAQVESTQRTLTTGNFVIEPNECNALNVRLTNSGGGAATAISSVLSSSTPGVTIAESSSGYPDLAPLGGNALNTTPFQISTDASVQCGSTVQLTQTVNYTGGESPRTFTFSLPVGTAGGNYTYASAGGGTVTPAETLLAGSQADDAALALNVPAGFGFSLYGTSYSGGQALTVSTNGTLQMGPGGNPAHVNTALPSAFTLPTIFAYWDDLDLRGGTNGIYTSLTGAAPNRVWRIEWRGFLFGASTSTVNFAIEIPEGGNNFRTVYANNAAASGTSATVGVQASATGAFTQFLSGTAGITPGQVLTATLPPPVCNPGPGVCVSDTLLRNGFEGP